jgi:hypothetical protein
VLSLPLRVEVISLTPALRCRAMFLVLFCERFGGVPEEVAEGNQCQLRQHLAARSQAQRSGEIIETDSIQGLLTIFTTRPARWRLRKK